MESFEDNEFENQPAAPEASETPQTPNPQNAQNTQGAEAGCPYTSQARRTSPYANSPYEMPHYGSGAPHEGTPRKPHKPKDHRSPIWRSVLAAVLVLVLVATGCGITAASINSRWEARDQALSEKLNVLQKQIDESAGTSKSYTVPTDGSAMTPAQLYAACVDSVVAITGTVTSNSVYGTTTGTSSGSGFILTEDGYIVTNCHVVEDADSLTVTTHDGTEYEAKLMGKDSTNDVAVLKVEATGLPAATLGSSHDLSIGDMVAAIGNPLGKLSATQTIGYVSGINREVSTSSGATTISMIQTDAAINPGNSGGPLFNMYGQVVGITTAKYSGTTNSGATIEGIGFAIPIDDVSSMFSDLIDHGYVSSAYLGVSVISVDEEEASRYNLPTGAYVKSVEAGGAAEKAGVQPKDIITDVGGHEVTNLTTLTRALRDFKGGDETTITVYRSGETLTLNITLEDKPQTDTTTQETQPSEQQQIPGDGSYNDWFDYFRRYFGG